jgi:hypothetical protein
MLGGLSIPSSIVGCAVDLFSRKIIDYAVSQSLESRKGMTKADQWDLTGHGIESILGGRVSDLSFPIGLWM